MHTAGIEFLVLLRTGTFFDASLLPALLHVALLGVS